MTVTWPVNDRGSAWDALARPINITRKPLSEVEAFLAESVRVVATYAVLCEAHNLVLQRLGAAYAREWLAEMMDRAGMLSPESS